ncbi:MAG: exodeoxyribonuclease V subunit beta [Deltaproteobacteria bacterium]|nr:exodeoxyribonuclease V subunit beta [Deltaproteobacteria bacterium]
MSQRFDPTGPLSQGTTLLEASAGTGKTYSITSLVVRLVVEKAIPIDRILAVTFTNLATAELTRKIRERLGEACAALTQAGREKKPIKDELLRHIVESAADQQELVDRAELARVALESFDRAPISTIHGFCQRILQQHALEAGVAFDVELLDDARQIIDEIVDDFWVKRMHDADELVLDALDVLGVARDDLRALARTAVSHWSAVVTPPRPDGAGPPDPAETRRVLRALERAAPLYSAHAAAALDAIIAAKPYHLERFFPFDSRFAAARRAAERVAGHELSPGLIADLALLDRGWVDTSFSRPPAFAHPEVFDATRELVAAYQAWLPLARPWALSLRHDLVDFARRESERRAGARRVWTFDDLLRKLGEALDDPARRARLEQAVGSHYRAVFIDEFQDTDPVQWRIFHALFGTKSHWLYLIGDPKQAIYRFRRADIRTYLKAKDAADHRFSLDTNYRSDAPVVAVTNAIFHGGSEPAAEMAFAVDGIGFSPSTASVGKRRLGLPGVKEDEIPPLRVLSIARTTTNTKAPPQEVQRSTIDRDWAERELPRHVAADIRRALGAGHRLTRTRADESVEVVDLEPRDIAVLVRTNRQATAVRDALRDVGVPGIVHGPESVYASEEAGELVRVLRAVLEPARTRVVRAALVTPLMGYTAEELARLDRDDPRALEAPALLLRDWQGTWMRKSFIQMFRQIASAATTRLLALHGGERKLANLVHLGELLHQASADRDLKPAGLLQFLEGQIKSPDESDERQQLRLESDDSAVQILTVHKAKGLEFELVWAPYVWESSFLRREDRRDLVFRDQTNRWEVTLDIGLDDGTPTRQTHLGLVEHEIQTEQLRLLYVALTRARMQTTITWGAFNHLQRSPLAYLLYAPVRAAHADALERTVKALKRLTRMSDHTLVHSMRLDKELYEIVSSSPDVDSKWAPPRSEQPIAARAWSRATPLDVAWRRTSFSGLVAELVDDEQALQKGTDEDAPIDADEALAIPTGALAERPVRLAELPSGRMVGNALHRILELADFASADRGSLGPLVADELAHHGIAPTTPAGEDLTLAVTEALIDVLDTPLHPAGFTLRAVARERRLPELAFVFPVAGGYRAGARRGQDFSVEDLRAAFETFAGPRHRPWTTTLGRLRFDAVRGFLSGSIDLAFRGPDDRFYVVDWKSNRLGPANVPSEYAEPGLWRGMDAHHYHLQYHLYTVAFDRFLASRLGRAYDYERDFGGVFYCFLRGMSPANPPGNGVFFDRPPRPLVEALDRAFGGRGAAGAPLGGHA